MGETGCQKEKLSGQEKAEIVQKIAKVIEEEVPLDERYSVMRGLSGLLFDRNLTFD